MAPAHGVWVGGIDGIALVVPVASEDAGVVPYISELINPWFGTALDPTSHSTILISTVVMIVLQTALNTVGAKVLGRVARIGVYVETIGTFGVAIALGIVGFHHGFGFLFETKGAEVAATNSLQVDFGGNWWTGAALVAVLAHVYIFYGFEAAGDVAEETVDATRQVPRAMRSALLYGGIASFVLVAGLLLATPSDAKGYASATSLAGGIPVILSQLPQWLQDFFLVMVILAFFSCGTAVQGAGARLAFSYSRDGALPGSTWMRRISPRFHTPSNALIVGALVPLLFTLLVNINPAKDVQILWFSFPHGINALTALVSFGVSGIYLSFLMTVIGSMIARARGWQPEGTFRLTRWAWPVSIVAAGYLALMLLNVLAPTGLSSPRGALFNLDWITLVVMLAIVIVGGVYFLLARPDRRLGAHMSTNEEATDADQDIG